MGLFTSPNNASIMGAAPAHQAGMASGVLNMTRGMGTGMGLALTGAIFTVTGGGQRNGGRRRPRLHGDGARPGRDLGGGRGRVGPALHRDARDATLTAVE